MGKNNIKILQFSLLIIIIGLNSCNYFVRPVEFRIYSDNEDKFLLHGEYINKTSLPLKLKRDFALSEYVDGGGINLHIVDNEGIKIKTFEICIRTWDWATRDTTFYLQPNDTLKCTFSAWRNSYNKDYIKVIANYNEVNSNELKIEF